MSTTTTYSYEQPLGLTLPIPSDMRDLQVDDFHFIYEKHTEEDLRRMYPDWDTWKPISFEEMKELIGNLELTPEEAEDFIQCIEENRAEGRRLANEREESERWDQ